MIKETTKTIYTTSDGQEWDDLAAAASHEAVLEHGEAIDRFLADSDYKARGKAMAKNAILAWEKDKAVSKAAAHPFDVRIGARDSAKRKRDE
jgi:hypothetical protein